MVSAYSVMANGGAADQAVADRPHPGPLRQDRLQARRARLRGLRRRGVDQPDRAGTDRQRRPGARSDDRLPDHVDDGRRGPARHGDDAARARSARSPARPARPTTRRTPGSSALRRTSSSASISASTSRSRSARAPPAAVSPRRSSRNSWPRRSRTRRRSTFQVPEGMTLIAINRKTGMRANEGDAGTIMEAFKPGTGPADSYWVIGMDAGGEMGDAISPQQAAPSSPAAAADCTRSLISSSDCANGIAVCVRRRRVLRQQGWADRRFAHFSFGALQLWTSSLWSAPIQQLHPTGSLSSHARGNRKARRRNQAGA